MKNVERKKTGVRHRQPDTDGTGEKRAMLIKVPPCGRI